MARKQAESVVGKYANVPTWNEKGKLSAGDQVEGYYIDHEEFDTKYGKMNTYIIETKEGLVKLVGQTDIKNKMVSVPAGCHVWVTFKGLEETSKGAKKAYDVEFDDEDVKKA